MLANSSIMFFGVTRESTVLRSKLCPAGGIMLLITQNKNDTFPSCGYKISNTFLRSLVAYCFLRKKG